jgi:hypothetical protein
MDGAARHDQQAAAGAGALAALPAQQSGPRPVSQFQVPHDRSATAALDNLPTGKEGHGVEMRNDECGMMNDECRKVYGGGRLPVLQRHAKRARVIHHSSFRIHHFLISLSPVFQEGFGEAEKLEECRP